MFPLLSSPAQLLRGNLHCHTTNSDGELAPPALARAYADAGYDFLAITDHERFTDPSVVADAGMIAVPGMELHGGMNAAGHEHHIVALGIDRAVERDPADGPQAIVDAIRDAGGQAIMAHPYWHGCTSADLLEVHGWLATEIYNHVCHAFIGKGESTETWDQVLAEGRKAWALAVDDCHLGGPDIHGGWVMVGARERTTEGVMEALIDGRFYSTCGPEIHAVERDGDRLHVRSSAAQTIALIGRGPTGDACHAPDGELIEEATLDLGRVKGYGRLLIRDARGRGAWTNPHFLT
jgi:hypothetical protein